MAELTKKRIARILTTDFPMYFALVSRVHLQLEQVGPEGGLITSPQVSQVQAVFPEGALQKRIKIGLQAQKVPPEQLLRSAGSRVTVSPIVTIEPRRRKFHRPITLAIPISKHYEPAQINMQPPDAQTLRLLCSITGARALLYPLLSSSSLLSPLLSIVSARASRCVSLQFILSALHCIALLSLACCFAAALSFPALPCPAPPRPVLRLTMIFACSTTEL